MRDITALPWLLCLFVGCLPTPSEPTPKEEAQPAAVAAPVMEPPGGQSEPLLTTVADETAAGATPVGSAAEEVKIEILDWAQTQAIVAAHPGKVVVFDLWATYCPPCLKELPGLVALQAKYPDEVVCVSVCLDYEGDADNPPAKIEPDIHEVLVKIKAHNVRNVLLSTPTVDVFKTIEHGSMPVLYVYDQTGKRVAMFPDLNEPVEPTYAKDVLPVVEQLLATPAKP